ncbi:hypothetical protein [uncultured Friedmanniella sp.]|uniref:hypothetical protein n=1 Tax=uncultured Friedmanniella sp. TaxID=335381 RepID=UPI0035C9DF4A
MEPEIYRDDDALLAALKEAMGAARHGQEELLLANASDAFSYASLDEELASLVYDSLLERDLAGTREVDDTRTVVFESEALSMEIEITGETLFGQIVPEGVREVTVEGPNGLSLQVVTDDLGCFTLQLPVEGAFRFRISRTGSTTVTEWTYVKPEG